MIEAFILNRPYDCVEDFFWKTEESRINELALATENVLLLVGYGTGKHLQRHIYSVPCKEVF